MDAKVPAAWDEPIKRYASYLAGIDKSGRTIAVRLYHMRRFANAVPLAPERVDTSRLIEYMARPTWGTHTRILVRATFLSFFGWAQEFNLISSNPAASIPKITKPVKAPRSVSRQAVGNALDSASPRVRLMILLAVVGGLKVMEIATCNARELTQHEDGTWTLRAIGTNGRTRDVPLRADLAKAIKDQGDAHTFPGRIDKHVSPAYVSRLISKALGDDMTSEMLRNAYRAGQLTFAQREVAAYHSPKALRMLDLEELAKSKNVAEQVARIEQNMIADPAAAIGSCKELLESVFKIFLTARNVEYRRKDDMPALWHKVLTELADSSPKAARDSIRQSLRTLMALVQGVTETRNQIGTGHGSATESVVEPWHARLVFNATVTVSEYVVDLWRAEEVSAA